MGVCQGSWESGAHSHQPHPAPATLGLSVINQPESLEALPPRLANCCRRPSDPHFRIIWGCPPLVLLEASELPYFPLWSVCPWGKANLLF